MTPETPLPDGAGAPNAGRGRPAASRSTWAEDQAAKFCGFPLTAETVFLRVKYEKGGEKEVCDLLLALRGEAIVLSLKHQEDPRGRTHERIARWCAKAAKGAVRQLEGAVKTITERPFWSDHLRRGRVEFSPGELHLHHAIAYIEAFGRVVLPADLPDEARGVPVTYLSSNDILNLIKELRSFPDITDYLDARLKMPADMQRTIGREKELVEYYLLNEETFEGCGSFDDLEAVLIANSHDLRRRITEKLMQDRFASEIECVADRLAERASDYAVGLDDDMLAMYDAPDKRSNYRMLQEHLCDLRLPERRLMGGQLAELRHQAGEHQGRIGHHVSISERKDFLYVLAASKGVGRPEIVKYAHGLLLAALAHYGKTDGMVIVDREGEGFVVALILGARHIPEVAAAGQELFGGQRMISKPLQLLPDERGATEL